MASEEGCVTVNWEIRNFSFLLRVDKGEILSSPWVVEDPEGREVRGKLKAYHYNSLMRFFVFGFNGIWVRSEMSFISSCGVVQLKADSSDTGFYLEKNALFNKNGQSILRNGTLTLCCRMRGKAIKTSECHIATVFHSLNHLWTIEKLVSSDTHQTFIEQENIKLYVSLTKNVYGEWMVMVEREPSLVDYALSIKDNCGRAITNQKRFVPGRFVPVPLKYRSGITSGSAQITGATLQLEFIVALHIRHELAASAQVVRETQLNPNSPTNTAKHENVSGALGDDLLLLYRDSALSDAILNTEGKSFSVHRSILAARSPVFRAMFEKDETSEVLSGVVDIDDVDSETVDRMLVYLYGDSVGDLEWKEASTLYYAADKYEILPLREKCADFLKACLAADNACDLLVLADRHSDQELMTCVVDFILGHEEVVSSVRWKELEKGNPMLCAKIATQLFLKKGKK